MDKIDKTGSGVLLRILAYATARDREERDMLEEIADAILRTKEDHEDYTPEWWETMARKTEVHGQYASSYPYAAASDAATLMCRGKWEMVGPALLKASAMVGITSIGADH